MTQLASQDIAAAIRSRRGAGWPGRLWPRFPSAIPIDLSHPMLMGGDLAIRGLRRHFDAPPSGYACNANRLQNGSSKANTKSTPRSVWIVRGALGINLRLAADPKI